MTWVGGTQDSACSSALMPCAQRATGGQVMVIAISPEFSAESNSPKPQFCTPGGWHLFCSTMSVSAFTPASLLTVAFMVSGSKNRPP